MPAPSRLRGNRSCRPRPSPESRDPCGRCSRQALLPARARPELSSFATKSCRAPFAKNQIEMDTKHLVRIQWRMSRKQALPDHRDHRGCDQDLRKLRQILVLDFTARDAELDRGPHAGETL